MNRLPHVPAPCRPAAGQGRSGPATARRSRYDAARSGRAGRPDRQHVRQVRLDQPGRPPADGRLRDATLDELFARAAPASVLDVGCGEGVLTPQMGGSGSASGRVVGIDLEDPKLEAEWATPPTRTWSSRRCAPSSCRSRDREFDLVAAIEVLEHVPDPSGRCREMARVARGTSARIGAARAAVARAERRARRLCPRPRQHPRARQPLVPAVRSCGCSGATARSSRCARRSRGRCCSSGSADGDPAIRRPPTASAQPADELAALQNARRRAPIASGARVLSIGIASTGHLHVRLSGHRQPRAQPGRLRPHLAAAGRSCS